MDIKSVIKTIAEAWAAASLKVDKSKSNNTDFPLPNNFGFTGIRIKGNFEVLSWHKNIIGHDRLWWAYKTYPPVKKIPLEYPN